MTFRAVVSVPIVCTLDGVTEVDVAVTEIRKWMSDQSQEIDGEIFYPKIITIVGPMKSIEEWKKTIMPPIEFEVELDDGSDEPDRA